MPAIPSYAVVLAAGEGTRFRSTLPKVLHPLCDKPMLEHILVQLRSLSLTQILVVVGNQAELIRDHFSGWSVEWVFQEQQLGTGHAVLMTEPWLKEKTGSVLVLHRGGARSDHQSPGEPHRIRARDPLAWQTAPHC